MNLIGATASRYTQVGNIADKAVLAGGLGYMGARNIGAKVGAVHRDIRPGIARNQAAAARRLLGGRE